MLIVCLPVLQATGALFIDFTEVVLSEKDCPEDCFSLRMLSYTFKDK